MAYLTIGGKQFEARTDFKFQSVADKKYSEKDADGKKLQGGVETIYSNLLEEDNLYLAYFWDCALSHYKDKPSVQEIENALMDAAGSECDFEPLFQDAFAQLDNSGFFRKKVKKFWKNLGMMEKMLNDESEKELYESQMSEYKETRSRLNPSI